MAGLKSSSQSFQFLEINLISAFDLNPPKGIAAREVNIYAVVSINPNQKFRSSVSKSSDHPKWNDRFVFIVDEHTLNSFTTAELVVELYAIDEKKKKDKLLGISRASLSTLTINCGRNYRCRGSIGAFQALNVRLSEGLHRHHSEGVLQLGVTLLEGLVCKAINEAPVIGSPINCRKLAARNKVADVFGLNLFEKNRMGFFEDPSALFPSLGF